MFGEYSISVNPDVSERYKYLTGSLLIYLKENYKITSFVPDDMGVHVRILDPVCRNLLNRTALQTISFAGTSECSCKHEGCWRAFI